MIKLPECRLLLDAEPHAGDWNMRVDESLLDLAARKSVATFRWYRWSEPTLSLGYFQRDEEAAADSRWAGLPKVRRLTGGGAILHHHEWTYSFAVPAEQKLFSHPEELYDLVHNGVIELLNRLGCVAKLRGETRVLPSEPWLCFARQDAHDVVWCGQKILGSAQRRRKGAVLQHGALLERASPLSPEHPGMMELGLPAPLTLELLSCIPERFADTLIICEGTGGQLTWDARKE